MSSTNRGGQRRPDDFYRTPRWAVEALLNSMGALPPGVILEPGCGDGAILKVLADYDTRGANYLVGVEQNAERAHVALEHCDRLLVEDFLKADVSDVHAVAVIGNPPYRDAEAFVRQSLKAVLHGGRVHLLLRLAFLAGQRRARSGLWENLKEVRILSKRPSFTATGTDSADYAWVTWERPLPGIDTSRQVLSMWILPPEPAGAGHVSQQVVGSAHE